MMNPDLIARTCGFVGVIAALVTVGVMDNPKFIVTPQQNFEAVLLSINVVEAKETDNLSDLDIPDNKKEEQETVEERVEPQKPIEEPKVEPQKPEVKEVPPPPKVEATPKPVEQQITPKKEPPKEVKKQTPTEVKAKEPKKSEPKKKQAPKDQAKSSKASSTNADDLKAQEAAAQAASDNRRLNAQLSNLLVREIQSKLRYPRNAVRRKIEGTVMVEFLIENGVVSSFRIEKSSGHKILDEAASKLAQSLVRFNTKLSTMKNRVLIPIKYELI